MFTLGFALSDDDEGVVLDRSKNCCENLMKLL